MGSAPGPIWLLGMMGAGKSSAGRALSAQLGLPFLDTDAEVERMAGCAVAEIFAREGEARFRELEREVIARVAGARAVVALGGGAPAQPAVAGLLRSSGVSVYLRAAPARLAERLGNAAARPLLAGRDAGARLERLEELLCERQAFYARADLVVDTDDADVEAVARRIAAALAAHERSPA